MFYTKREACEKLLEGTLTDSLILNARVASIIW